VNALRLLIAFVRRDAQIAASYRVAFLAPLLSVFFAVPILYYLSRVFERAPTDTLNAYGGGFFAFILLGMAFQDYVTVSMSNFLSGIREHQLMGTMEIVMLSPTPVSLVLLFSSVWGYLFTSIRFLLYIVLGVAFGLDLSSANLLSFAVLTALSVVSFSALGILGAAATLIIKQGASITGFLTAATLALGGVAYPIAVLPAWLQKVALLLPFTHALEGVRKALLANAGLASLGTELVVLTAFGTVLFPLSIWVFHRAVQHVKSTGTLGQY
jgi:ABC-2 type transport system permease protein